MHAAKYFMFFLSTVLFGAFIAEPTQKHNEKDSGILSELAFKKASVQGRGRLVPVKRSATDKTRGRARPRPILERAPPQH